MKTMLLLITLALLLFAALAHAADPAPMDLTCNQGEDCRVVVTLKAGGWPIDLAGYTFRSQVRASYTDANPLASFTVNSATGVKGQIVMILPSAVTTSLAGKAAVWDLQQIEPEGLVTYLLRGRIRFLWSVTR